MDGTDRRTVPGEVGLVSLAHGPQWQLMRQRSSNPVTETEGTGEIDWRGSCLE